MTQSSNDNGIPRIRSLRNKAGLILDNPVSAMLEQLREKPNTVYFCAHVGSSMHPTLNELDLLEIMPYGKKTLRAGDVILFLPPEANQPVVHRVDRMTKDSIRTHGDNNIGNDPWLLQHDDVVGRVVSAWRGQRQRRIPGGKLGRLTSLSVRWILALDRGISRLLHPIYYSLACTGVVRRLLPSRLRPRVVVYRAGDQTQLRLVAGKHGVGKFDNRRCQWQIQRPFRLFVNEAALPVPKELNRS